MQEQIRLKIRMLAASPAHVAPQRGNFDRP
jgi:hypothetical protein